MTPIRLIAIWWIRPTPAPPVTAAADSPRASPSPVAPASPPPAATDAPLESAAQDVVTAEGTFIARAGHSFSGRFRQMRKGFRQPRLLELVLAPPRRALHGRPPQAPPRSCHTPAQRYSSPSRPDARLARCRRSRLWTTFSRRRAAAFSVCSPEACLAS
jgi:hypothetical protein